ncbi:MAG: acyloxyacyl hydrolase [Flavobacteriales bacterium]|nr:acyloxyacyl hydrolase [Flavobacteriales bacterium]
MKFLLLLLSVPVLVFGQSNKWDIEVSPLGGVLMPHHADMEYLVDGHVLGGEVTFSKRADGSKDWHHRFLFPRWGVALNAYDLGSSHLGTGYASRLFFDLPLNKTRELGLKISFGAGWITNPFDEEDNVRNSAIGSSLNATVGLEVHYNLNLSDKISIRPGIGIHHYSNGAWKMPNSGINLGLLRVGIMYRFEESEIPEILIKEMGPQTSEILAGISGGLKEILPIGGDKYGVLNLFGIYQKRISGKSTFGGEIGLNYNESLQYKNDDSPSDGPNQSDNYRAYISALYQLNFDPIAIRFSLGSYIAPRFTDDGFIFLRYHLVYEVERFQLFIGLKSHYAKADNGELGIAYRLK